MPLSPFFYFMKRRLSIIVATFLISVSASAQQIAVKTNLLSDVVLTPSLGLELVTGEHMSLDFTFYGNYIPFWVNSTVLAFQPECRYWFNGRPMTREYIGIAALATIYDIALGKYVYDGEAAGGGFTGGYVFNLTDRWNVELSGGVGVLFFNQKQYYRDDNYDDYVSGSGPQANVWGYKLLPIKLGVSVSYIIK